MSELEQWPGVTRDFSDIGVGCDYAQNMRWWTTGELQRRHGLTKLAAIGAGANLCATRFWNPTTGYVAVFFTATGTVETASA